MSITASDYKILGAFNHREEPPTFHIRIPSGMFCYLFVHFYNPVNIQIDDCFEQTERDACIIYSPNYPQDYRAAENPFINDYVKFLTPDDEYIASLGLPLNEVFYIDGSVRINELVGRITWMLTDVITDHRESMSKLLGEILCELQCRRLTERPKVKRETALKRRLIVLREAVRKEPWEWSVEKMAQAFYLTRSHFTVIYRKQFGIPPKNDLLNFTMEYAEQLLKATNGPINEIAEKCGYSCSENFIRAFGRYFGTTPNKYRNENKA